MFIWYTLFMVFSNDSFIRMMIFVLGLCGFLVARHIYKHKKANKPLVCPVGFDCSFVVHSNYSEFMHIPLEIFGMFYYAFLSLFYLYSVFFLEIMSILLSSFLMLVSFSAFSLSMYLLFVQIFILKKGCSWCIISSIISVLIFILIAFSYDFGVII